MWISANAQAGMTRTVWSAIGVPSAPRTITSTSPVGAHSTSRFITPPRSRQVALTCLMIASAAV